MSASFQNTSYFLSVEKTEPNTYGNFFCKIYDMVFFPFLHPIRKKIVREIQELRPKSVIGCGTGNQIKYLCKSKIPNLVGIDISDTMLVVARKRGLTKYCQKKDATNTHYADNVYDAAIINFVLHETPPDVGQNIVNETIRIVKQGGTIIFTDYHLDKKTSLMGKIGASFIEKLIGGTHYRNFKLYVENQMIDKYTIALEKRLEHSLWFRSVRIQIFKNLKRGLY